MLRPYGCRPGHIQKPLACVSSRDGVERERAERDKKSPLPFEAQGRQKAGAIKARVIQVAALVTKILHGRPKGFGGTGGWMGVCWGFR